MIHKASGIFCAAAFFLSETDGGAHARQSVAGAGIYFDTASQSFVIGSELLVSGSNSWPLNFSYNRAVAVVEFSTTQLNPGDKHFLSFPETGSTVTCQGTPNRFLLFGYSGDGVTQVSDAANTNLLLMSFETPRGYAAANTRLDVSQFVNGLVASNRSYAGFVITPADSCAFEGFGFAAQNPTFEPQVTLVSTPVTHLEIQVASGNVTLTWHEDPMHLAFTLESSPSVGNAVWEPVTNGTSSYVDGRRIVVLPLGNESQRFFRLRGEH